MTRCSNERLRDEGRGGARYARVGDPSPAFKTEIRSAGECWNVSAAEPVLCGAPSYTASRS